MATYRLDILVTAQDRASNALWSTHGALRRILFIASGVLVAQAIRGITSFFGSIIGGSFEAFTRLERMQVSLETLIAGEISRGKTTEVTSTIIRRLTEMEVLALDKLKIKYAELSSELEDLESHYKDVTAEHGEQSIEALKVSVALREVKNELAETSTEMERLASAEGALVTVTEQVASGQLSFADALARSSGPAKQLLDWITQLALRSPFEEKDVLAILNTAIGYGFITQHASELGSETAKLTQAQEDEVVTAQRLTVALMSMGAAFPIVAEAMPRVIKAFGDVQAHGRVLSHELRQLANAGIGVEFLARAMGVTTQEFQKLRDAGIDADTFITSVVETIERDFIGTEERMLATAFGLQLAFKELVPIMGRAFFGPTIQAAVPGLLEFFNQISSPEALADAEAAGARFRDRLIEIWNWLDKVHGLLSRIVQEPFDATLNIALMLFGMSFSDAITFRLNLQREFDKLNISIPVNLGFGDPEAGMSAAAKNLLTFFGLGALFGRPARGLSVGAIIKGGLVFRIGAAIFGVFKGILGRIGPVGLAITAFSLIWEGDWLGIRTAVTTAWEEDIKPALGDIWKWFQEDLPAAIATAKTWIDGTAIPFLERLAIKAGSRVSGAFQMLTKWIKLNFPEAVEIAEQAGIKLAGFLGGSVNDAVVKIAEKLPEFVGNWNTFAKDLEERIVPNLVALIDKGLEIGGDIFGFLFGPFLTFGGEVYGPLLELLGGTDRGLIGLVMALAGFSADRAAGVGGLFGSIADLVGGRVEAAIEFFGAIAGFLAEIAGMSLRNIGRLAGFFTPLVELFGIIREETAETAGTLVASFLTLITPIVDFIGQDFLPVLGELFDVLDLIRELFLNTLFNAIDAFVIGPLDALGQKLFVDIKPVWEAIVGFLGDAFTFFHETLRGAITGFTTLALGPLNRVLGTLRDILSKVKEFLAGIKWILENTEFPEWMQRNSPSEVEMTFMGWAAALREVNEEAAKNPFLRPGGAVTRGTFALGGFNAGGRQMATQVIFEGDQNTYNVPDRGTAVVLSKLIAQEKRARFNDFMGV